MTAAVSPIRPAVATAELTRWPCLLDPNGAAEVRTWDELFDEFSKIAPFRGKETHPGWSAALFENDKRAKAGVLRVTAAVLDYDHSATVAEAIETWAGHSGLLHTTKSHTSEAQSFRVILPLRRPVSAFEWDILWARLSEHSSGATDPQAKDASRFWYQPGILEGGEFFARRLDGQALDPDVWLRKPPKVAPAVYVAPDRPYRDTSGGMSAEERASRYVAKMPEAVDGQNGHGSTWKAALTCARGFELDRAATMRVLREHNQRCQPQWTERELEHKADNAANANVPLGYLLNRDRPGWTAPSYPSEPVRQFDADGVLIEPSVAPAPEPPQLAKAPELAARPTKPARSMAEMFADVIAMAESGKRETGVDTCHFQLQHMLAGFRPQMITVLGARTSFGKSSYAIMVADEAMRLGQGVLLVTAEDAERTYAQRFMARRAKVSAFKLRANECTPEELLRMKAQARHAETIPFFLDMVGKSAEDIAAGIRAECKLRPIKIVIVDYLQRIGATKRTQDKRTEVTHVMTCIADAIKESNAAGLVLSQLKRLEGGGDKEPGMGDLKESGDIENMAEHVVLGWLSEDKDGGDVPKRRRFLKVEKNKDGPVDTRAMTIPFDENTASFRVQPGQVYETTAPSEFDDVCEPGDAWAP